MMKISWFLLLLFAFLFSYCYPVMAEEMDLPLPEALETMDDKNILVMLEQAVIEKKGDMVFAVIMELRKRWETNPAIGDMILESIDDKAKDESYRLILLNEIVTSQGNVRMPGKRLMAPGQQEGYQKKMVRMLAARIEDPVDSPAIRGEAAIELGVIDKSKETVKVLARALKDTDEDVSSRAAFALKLVGDKEAAPDLLSRLQGLMDNPDEQPDLVRRTMVSLGRLDAEQAIDTINSIAQKTEDVGIFGSAVHSLGVMHKQQLIPMILDLWNSTDRFSLLADRAMANLSCWSAMRENEGMIMEILSSSAPETAMKAIQKIQSLHGMVDENKAIDDLQKHLASHDRDIKILAIQTLAGFKSSTIKELLLEARKTETDTTVLNVLDNSLLRMGVVIINGRVVE
ncbi:MAG: HEAT repeat domain-containing protein [bacterium]|nr:HEAT repeat domain-containing protein [bacterium]